MRFEYAWDLGTRHFELTWDAPTAADRDDLLRALRYEYPHDVLDSRKYAFYLREDPYREIVRSLAGELAAAARHHGIALKSLAGLTFLLHFVHRLDYIKDPKIGQDYPRYASETIIAGGGDCEDGAMLFCALASYFGHRTCLLSLVGRRHMAAGVSHDDAEGVSYTYDGIRYHIAETAIDGNGYVEIGEPFSFSRRAHAVVVPLPAGDTGIEPLEDTGTAPSTASVTRLRPERLVLKGLRCRVEALESKVIGRGDLGGEVGAETVSRQHARLFAEGGRWYIIALPSLNGTVVQGRPLPEFRRHELCAGNVLRLGRVRLVASIG